MQHLDKELAVRQQGARAVAELAVEVAVAFLRVPAPALFAGEVVARQVSPSRQEEDQLAVGGRGGGGEKILGSLVSIVFAFSKQAAPERLAVFPVQGQGAHHPGLSVEGGEEDLLADDDRGAARRPRQGCLPLDVFLRPEFFRRALLLAGAVVVRTAPTGPVVAQQHRRSESANGQQRNEAVFLTMFPGHGWYG